MKIAIFLPNWLGDLAMATPTLRAMRKHFGPDAKLVGIMRPYLAEVLGGTDWLTEQWFFDPRARDRRLRSLALARRMRRERFDLAVLLTNSLRTALVARLAGIPRRVGYVRYGRGPLLTDRLVSEKGSDPLDSRGLTPFRIGTKREGRRPAVAPVVFTYLALAEAVGCPPESPRLELATTEEDERSADLVWERLGLRGDGRVVMLNCSGAHGGAKLWPVEYFARLARLVVERLDHDVLVMCGPGERQLARDIVRQSGAERVFSMADQPLGLGTAKACIRRGGLMVSTDSGPKHVAAALDKPLVGLHGPFLPEQSYNPTQRAERLILDLDCAGCGKRVCPLGHHRCMRELDVETVYAAVVRLLDQERKTRAA